MKKTLLKLSPLFVVGYLVVSAYSTGPANVANLNRTGAGGSTANCSGSGCHVANNLALGLNLTLTSGVNSVSKYEPGVTYDLTLTGTTTFGNFPKYGMQVAAVKASATGQNAGTLALGTATGLSVKTVGGITIIEHNAKQDGSGSGNAWGYFKTIKWTAPPAGTGTVNFYLTMNAVNNNGTEAGDLPNNKMFAIQEIPASISNIQNEKEQFVYPNPATDVLYIKGLTTKASVRIYDLSGKMLIHTNTVSGSPAINIANLPGGMYRMVVQDDQDNMTYYTFVHQN